MEELRQSIGLRSYGQKDPLNEYKSEAYVYFEQMMNIIRASVCSGIFRSATNVKSFENMLAMLSRSARTTGPADAVEALVAASGPGVKPGVERAPMTKVTIKRDHPKVGRNNPCPCGSGKKYKKCCYPKYG